jgi:hypothetical protein
MAPEESLKEQTIQFLVIGTLALMTHYAQTGCYEGARRIEENLRQMSGMRDLPWEFRAAVTKLAARWDHLQGAILDSAQDRGPGDALH